MISDNFYCSVSFVDISLCLICLWPIFISYIPLTIIISLNWKVEKKKEIKCLISQYILFLLFSIKATLLK